MKKIGFLTVLVLIAFASGMCAAEVPSLLGKWSGSFNSCGNAHSNWVNGSNSFTITEQKDRIFAGNLTIKLMNGTEYSQNFAGAIGLDNKTFCLAESNNGYGLGTIITRDEIEYIYLTDGESGSVAIDKLHRKAA
jgi:hypothetical protein